MKELRVYVVNIDILEEYTNFITNDVFIELAKKQGTVYSLKGFELAFNYQEINSDTDMIRFIEIEV